MLTEFLRAGRTGLWRAMRARAVLLAVSGASVSDIARRVATTWGYIRPTVSKSTVGRWLKDAALKPQIAEKKDEPKAPSAGA